MLQRTSRHPTRKHPEHASFAMVSSVRPFGCSPSKGHLESSRGISLEDMCGLSARFGYRTPKTDSQV